MNIVQITPGAGGMFCGNCFRDNALVAELRRQGHNALMVPLYLPLTLDEPDQSAQTPIFFSGINVYLAQTLRWFSRAPAWMRHLLANRWLLSRISSRAAKTRPEDVGELTVSMLKGEHGHQAGELEDLIAWLQTSCQPDLICLSNALLIGLARRLKEAFPSSTLVVCLQGEDYFLDSLSEPHRSDAWTLVGERLKDADLYVAPSRYYGESLIRRVQGDPSKLRVVANGINLDGYETRKDLPPPTRPTIGYFARMCREKGVDVIVDAYIELRRRGRVDAPRLKIGGGCGPTDEPVVAELKQRLEQAGVSADVEWHPNLTREQKLSFLQSLSVFSVPARYGEGFGLYLIEAMAAGVPVVQPRHAAFPEIVDLTGGGILCEPENPASLAEALESLLADETKRRQLGLAGKAAIHSGFTVQAMAQQTLALIPAAASPSPRTAADPPPAAPHLASTSG